MEIVVVISFGAFNWHNILNTFYCIYTISIVIKLLFNAQCRFMLGWSLRAWPSILRSGWVLKFALTSYYTKIVG